MDIGLV